MSNYPQSIVVPVQVHIMIQSKRRNWNVLGTRTVSDFKGSVQEAVPLKLAWRMNSIQSAIRIAAYGKKVLETVFVVCALINLNSMAHT